jgi:hypothetical protein
MEKSLRIVLLDKGEVLVTNFHPTEEKEITETEALLTSKATMDWHGNSSTPTLTNKKQRIIVTHQNVGGGHLDWTRLTGPSGTYFFQTPGTYDVVPGTYSHFVSGYIGGDDQASKIISTIKYE